MIAIRIDLVVEGTIATSLLHSSDERFCHQIGIRFRPRIGFGYPGGALPLCLAESGVLLLGEQRTRRPYSLFGSGGLPRRRPGRRRSLAQSKLPASLVGISTLGSRRRRGRSAGPLRRPGRQRTHHHRRQRRGRRRTGRRGPADPRGSPRAGRRLPSRDLRPRGLPRPGLERGRTDRR